MQRLGILKILAAKCNRVTGDQGVSLVELLVVVAISSVVMMAIVSTQVSQQREATALGQKLASMDLEKLLIASLADGSVCTYMTSLAQCPTCKFNSTQVSATKPQLVTPMNATGAPIPIYGSIQAGSPPVPGVVVAKVGQAASGLSTSAIIKTIELSVDGAPSVPPPNGPGAKFTGHWIVSMDSTKLVRVILPVSVSTTLTVDTTNPLKAIVTGCQSSGSGGPSIKQACVWVAANTLSSCNPPACAAGFQDLGVTGLEVTASGGTSIVWNGGDSYRYCSGKYTNVVEMKCPWIQVNGLGACAPPACPIGYADTGVLSSEYRAFVPGPGIGFNLGNSIRNCYQ